MNFLGIGTGELILILIIAAMVVGPERMVELSRTAGRLLGKLRRETDGITKEFREAISTFDDVNQVANEAKSALGDLSAEVTQASQEVKQTTQEIQQVAKDVRQTVSETKTAAIAAGTVKPTTPKPASTTPTVAKPPTPAAKPTVKPAATAPTSAASKPASTPPKPKPVVPLLDGEIATSTPAVARFSSADGAAEVALAEIVPDNPADVAPVEITQPTLMVDEADLAVQPVDEEAPAQVETETEAQIEIEAEAEEEVKVQEEPSVPAAPDEAQPIVTTDVPTESQG